MDIVTINLIYNLCYDSVQIYLRLYHTTLLVNILFEIVGINKISY